jgi:peptidoglycan/LPS O-acetylase OafA/YrhL
VGRERLGWSPGLESLRGIAVLAVMLFHAKTGEWFRGGSLGVDLFFVLSGFLITTLLAHEYLDHGRISLRNFYARRAVRLLPALGAFLAVYMAVALVFDGAGFLGRSDPARVVGSATAALLYVFNFIHMFGGLSTAGTSHLWSLSVEEQFYIAWPLCLLALRLRRGAFVLMFLTAAAAIASGLLPIVTAGSYNRFYFGTDFRAQELLAGALVAQLFVAGWVGRHTMAEAWFRIAAAAAGLFFAVWLFALHDRREFLFHGWYIGVAAAGAVVVLFCAFTTSPWLTNPILRYVGSRSYALYLWHLPFNTWFRELNAGWHVLAVFTVSFAAAELSYRLVEGPVQRWHRRQAGTAPIRAAEPEAAAA